MRLRAPPTPELSAAFLEAFPDGRCRPGDECFDFGAMGMACTCGVGDGGGHCTAFVQQVDADEHRAVCDLSVQATSLGVEIVCGGDF